MYLATIHHLSKQINDAGVYGDANRPTCMAVVWSNVIISSSSSSSCCSGQLSVAVVDLLTTNQQQVLNNYREGWISTNHHIRSSYYNYYHT
jgi:hypothetical protein